MTRRRTPFGIATPVRASDRKREAIARRPLELRDRGPLEELHGDERLAPGLAHLVRANHVRVLEAGENRGLAKEPLLHRRFVREGGGDPLEGHEATPDRPSLISGIDDTHRACANSP